MNWGIPMKSLLDKLPRVLDTFGRSSPPLDATDGEVSTSSAT